MKPTTKIEVLVTTGFILFLTGSIHAQRQMEKLSRGVIAVEQGDGNVYVGWRMLEPNLITSPSTYTETISVLIVSL